MFPYVILLTRRNVERMVDVPLAVPLVLDQLVPQERAQQRSVEQVVSGRNAEQVFDVPVPCVAPGFARVPQHETPLTRAAAAWLDAPQQQFEGGVFALFPDPKKVRMSHLAVECGPGRALQLIHVVCRDWVDDNDGAWTVLEAAQGTFLAQLAHATLPVAPAVKPLNPLLMVHGVKGLASLGPFLGAPGQVKHTAGQGVQFQDKWLRPVVMQ